MKRNRNSHRGFGLPLFISFNELAWLAVVGVVLIAAPQLAKGKQQTSNLPEEKKEQSQSSKQEPEPTFTEEDKLRNQLTETKQELAEEQNQLEKVEQNLAAAKSKKAELEKQLKSMEQERDRALAEKRKMRDQLEKLREHLEETKRKLEVAESKKYELLAKINALEKQLEETAQELAKTQNQLEETKQKLTKAQNQPERMEQVVRKELLGLKGELEHVGILLDRSASMKKGNRWQESIKIVETWLSLLPIENCFLIPYNDTPYTFQTNKYLPVSGTNGIKRREWLIQQIRDIQPTGGTHIIKALEKAYEYPNLQTIILFTDGRSGNTEKIRQLCRNEKQRRGVTVNVVAIGDYFEEKIGEFLRNVAKETGGAFIGR